MVSSGSSFGGNSLVIHVGLDNAKKADLVTVTWPVSKTSQTFRDVDADQSLEVVEGATAYRKLPVRRLGAAEARVGHAGRPVPSTTRGISRSEVSW